MGNVWVGTKDNVMLQFWSTVATVADIEEARQAMRRLRAQHPAGIFNLTVVNSSGPPRLGDAERQMIRALRAEMKPVVVAAAQVVDGTGFIASALRAMLMTMGLLDSTSKVFDSIGGATKWMASRGQLDAEALAKHVEQALATWRASA